MEEIVIQPIKKDVAEADIVEAQNTLAVVRATIITTQPEAETVKTRRKDIDNKIKEIEGKYFAISRPIRAGLTILKELFDTPLDMLKKAKELDGKSLLAWQDKCAEEARQQAEALKKLQEKEAEKLEKKAEKQELKGNAEQAEIMRQEADRKKNIMPAVEPDKTVSVKTTYSFASYDVEKVPEVLNGIRLKIVDEKQLNKLINSSKGQIQIPGVTIKENRTAINR